MYNISELKERELLHHLSLYAETIVRTIYDLCDIEFLTGVPLHSKTEEATMDNLTIMIHFTGTVQGTYAMTIPEDVAQKMLDISPEKATVDDYAAGLFEEIINIAVGTAIEGLKEQFGFLTFNPPVVVLGEIRFPSFRNCRVELISDIGTIAAFFAVNMANLEITDKLISTMQNLRKQQTLNLKDSLTGIYNRAYYEYYKEKLFGAKKPLSFVMFDVDNFKTINDSYGHSTGDLALQHIADCVKTSVRNSDLPIRFGGDEFIIILEESALLGARKLVERIANKLKVKPLRINENQTHTITISAGITEHVAGETFEQLFKRADSRLYEAKENGRNQICG